MTNQHASTALLSALIADSHLPPQLRTAQFAAANDDETPPPTKANGTSKLLTAMNRQFSVVDVKGKAFVVGFKDDALGHNTPVFYTFDAFKQLHHIKFGKTSIGTMWLAQPGRPQYSGITFKPGKNGRGIDDGKNLNLWRGFGIESAPGDWSLMRTHIREVLANGNEEHADYIMRWLAWAVQNPGERAEVFLVFKSDEEGSGKGALGNTLVTIFGAHGRRISQHKHLTGNFNMHLQDLSLLFADEAFWPGDRAAEGVLKALITEPTFIVEPKGVNAYDMPNALHGIMASNNSWSVPAGPTARRFAVFRVSGARVGDAAYFNALFAQLDSGGRQAMLHDLLAMELGDWHPRNNVPKTEELLIEKINTLEPDLGWWLDILMSAKLPTFPPLAANQVVTEYLYSGYLKRAGDAGARYKGIQTKLGMFLKKLMPTLQKKLMDYREGGNDKQGMVYTFPPLAECRAAFDNHLQQRWAWDEVEEWQSPIVDSEGEEGPI